jgi:TRAP-type C4-dicarboxylate transport system permease large subunit
VTLSGFAGGETWPLPPPEAGAFPLELIFRGILPLLMALIIAVILMVLFPQIALFLPGLMR